jgi:flavodoxin
MKKLVVFYSQANGNTKRIAEMIAEKTGADIAAIDTVTPYTGTYDEIVNQGQEEVNRGFQPEIKDIGVNLIFLGKRLQCSRRMEAGRDIP